MKTTSKSIATPINDDCLTQLILNTRCISARPLDNLHPAIHACNVPIITRACHCIPALPQFTVELGPREMGSLDFVVSKSGASIIVSALVWERRQETDAWAWLMTLFDKFVAPYVDWDFGPPPGKPGQLPWLGTVWMPAIGKLTPEEAKLVVGFASSFSLTVLQYLKSQN